MARSPTSAGFRFSFVIPAKSRYPVKVNSTNGATAALVLDSDFRRNDGVPMTAIPDSPLATLWCPTPNREPRRENRVPDMLVLHYTGMESSDAALDWLTREESKVSCHYLVDEDGRIAQMVRGRT